MRKRASKNHFDVWKICSVYQKIFHFFHSDLNLKEIIDLFIALLAELNFNIFTQHLPVVKNLQRNAE
jgi:hypothetical protein